MDGLEWLPSVMESSVHLIVRDGPWGILERGKIKRNPVVSSQAGGQHVATQPEKPEKPVRPLRKASGRGKKSGQGRRSRRPPGYI